MSEILKKILNKYLVASMLATSLVLTPVSVRPSAMVQTTLEQKVEETTLKEVYGYENIYLKNFYELTFEDTKKIYAIPSDLEDVLDSDYTERQTEVKNKAKFKREVLKIAKKLGYSERKIKKLPPLEALELAAEIVAENYTYTSINYSDKSIDEIFYTKKAKCTDYMYSVIAVFDLIKEMNPNLNNVYVTTHLFCRYIGHAWNTIVVMGEKDMQIAYFDSTWYDTKAAEDLNATDRWHVDFERWRSQLYAELDDYDSAQKELKPLIKKADDPRRLEQLLERSAYYYFQAEDYESSLEVYKRLVDKFTESRDRDEYFYYLGWGYYHLGDYESTQECIDILRTQYPNSSYQLDYLEKRLKEEKKPKVEPKPKPEPKPEPKKEPPKPKPPKKKEDPFLEKDEEWWELYGP